MYPSSGKKKRRFGMKKTLNFTPVSRSRLCTTIPWQTRFAIWWLSNFEAIIHFWTGFSWIWALTFILLALVGYIPLYKALGILFFTGITLQSGMFLCIRFIAAHLNSMEEGTEKDRAHDLMIHIIRRRIGKTR
jgi:hypothetical protein